MKACAVCRIEKPLSEFYMQTHSRKPFGKCKTCLADAYRKRADARLALLPPKPLRMRRERPATRPHRLDALEKSHPREHSSWYSMKQRCMNPNNPAYANYGGRGIQVCARWNESFANFYADMGDRPLDHSIDRIDNDGHYEPRNCRWATRLEQSRNKRDRRWYTYGGETLSLKEWAARLNAPTATIFARVHRCGWPLDKAFTIAPRKYRTTERSA
jgi:hypothetical protein